MKVSTRINIYFFSAMAVGLLSAESFLKYDKTKKSIWLIPTILFAAAFLAVVIDLFRWWAKVYKRKH